MIYKLEKNTFDLKKLTKFKQNQAITYGFCSF